ncbi:hypothetical protein LINPERPRIM_LOCUS2722, partial [Linum perenne]
VGHLSLSTAILRRSPQSTAAGRQSAPSPVTSPSPSPPVDLQSESSAAVDLHQPILHSPADYFAVVDLHQPPLISRLHSPPEQNRGARFRSFHS